MKMDNEVKALTCLIVVVAIAIATSPLRANTSPAKSMEKVCNIKMIFANYTSSAVSVIAANARNNRNETLNIKNKAFKVTGIPVYYGDYKLSFTSPLTAVNFDICIGGNCKKTLLNISATDWSDIHPRRFRLGQNNYYLTMLGDCDYLTISIDKVSDRNEKNLPSSYRF